MAQLTVVRTCIDGLISSEVSKKKAAVKQLRDLMNDRSVVQLLNRSSSNLDINWNIIFNAAHMLLLKETEKVRNEERRGTHSAAAATRRKVVKSDCAGLVSVVVSKANQGFGRIKCSNLIAAVLEVLSDNYLRENYSDVYVEIMRSRLLPFRTYWGSITEEQWSDLNAAFWKLLQTPLLHMEISAIADVLSWIIKCGGAQSFIGLKLKKKIPLLADIFKDQSFLQFSIGAQESFLLLAITLCTEMATDCRMGVCQFGEMVLLQVLHLYDKLSKQKSVVLEFLLLQVKLHHPFGATEKEPYGAAYAANWDQWLSHLRSLYSLVESEFSHIQNNKQRGMSQPKLLQLAVEVCRQVFHHNDSVLNVSRAVSLNESSGGQSIKRRRVNTGLQDVIDNISIPRSVHDPSSWLSVLSELLLKYPSVVKEDDFVPLLQAVTDLFCSSKDSFIMTHLCRCSISLIKVEVHLKNEGVSFEVTGSLWRKIVEVVLRMIGLHHNGCESHILLQELIYNGKAPNVLNDILHLYASGSVKQSNESLDTLRIVCMQYELPEYLYAGYKTFNIRESLISWLMPEGNILLNLSPVISSLLLVLLCFKTGLKIRYDFKIVNERNEHNDSVTAIEKNYVLSSFEGGLPEFMEESKDCLFKVTNINSKDCVINMEAVIALEEIVGKHSLQLLEKNQFESREEKTKFIEDILLYSEFLLNLWSWMLEFGFIPSDRIPRFFSSLLTVMDKLNDMCAAGLFSCHLASASKFVQGLHKVLKTQSHQIVSSKLREIIRINVLETVFNILTTNHIPRKDEDDEDEESEDDDDCMEFEVVGSAIRSKSSCDHQLTVQCETVSERQELHMDCVRTLSSYCSGSGSGSLNSNQTCYLLKILNFLSSDNCGGTSSSKFHMAAVALQNVLSSPFLKRIHVAHCLKVLQCMCKSYHRDHEAATKIMKLLRECLRYVHNVGEKIDKENTIVLLRGLQKLVAKKQYGPEVIAAYIHCLGETAKVDSDALWTKWNCGSKLPCSSSDREATPVMEEILFYLQNPFHDLRISAIMYIPFLFKPNVEKQDVQKRAWQKDMFVTFCEQVMQSFIVEGELSEQERVDECANRAATALHAVAALIVSSPVHRKQGLFFLLLLIKEKNINIGRVERVLHIIGRNLKILDMKKLICVHLNYFLLNWLQKKYGIESFPWKLLGCTSEKEFYITYLDTIITLIFWEKDRQSIEEICLKVKKDVSEVMEACYPHVIGRLLPYFSMKMEETSEVYAAKQLLETLEQILGPERVKELLSENLYIVVVTLFRLLFDHSRYENICNCINILPDPVPPKFQMADIMGTLEYLQINSPDPEVRLIQFLAKSMPCTVQKILLHLADDIFQVSTFEERIICLLRYSSFVDVIASELEMNGMDKMELYVIRDIVYLLINIVKQGYVEKEYLLASTACRFLLIFFCKCLPKCAHIIEKFVNVCTGTLVPIAKFDGLVSTEARKLLTFLIVENRELLSSSIRLVGPFPSHYYFNDMQEVYRKLYYDNKEYTLEEEILHFLKAVRVNSGCHAEGLKYLHSQLSSRKEELRALYLALSEVRGFSEDCENSILHQLLCVLVKLAMIDNKDIQVEATRCLGELGPADLTTLVLKPERNEHVFNENLVVSLISHILNQLTTALIDSDITVVKAASRTLYILLATKEAHEFTGSNFSKNCNMEYLIPFISVKKPRHESVFEINEDMFKQNIDCSELWSPTSCCSHDKWITTLVCSILQTFSVDKCFLPHLIPMCKIKVTFAAAVLPFLLEFVLCSNYMECKEIVISNIQLFFSHHFLKHLEMSEEFSACGKVMPSQSKSLVTMNRASVQCMLDAVHFLRLRRHTQTAVSDLEFKLNFLHIALAAQYCSAYFTSILYAELWCMTKISSIPGRDSNISTLEFVSENDERNGKVLQYILWEAYSKIDDNDAVYGCGSSQMLGSKSSVRHFEISGKWDRVLQIYELELSNGNNSSTSGLLFALQRSGLHHILNRYITSSSKSNCVPVNNEQDYYYDCLWRLSQWNAPVYNYIQCKNGISSSSYEKCHYSALNALNQCDKSVFQDSLTAARFFVIESLAHSSLESSKGIYLSLSQLRVLQEMEEFAEAMYLTDLKNLDEVMNKLQQQDILNYNDFKYVEPFLMQRMVMLKIIEKKCENKTQVGHILASSSLETATVARRETHFDVAARSLAMISHISSLLPEITLNLKYEEAKLAWDRNDKEVALSILRRLLNRLENEGGKWYALSLKLYGDWLVETKSDNAQVILNDFFMKALNIMENVNTNTTDKIQAYWSLAHFSDSQYQQINRYFKSAEYEVKQKCMEKAISNAQQLRRQCEESGSWSEDEKRAYSICDRQTKIDRAEILNKQKETDIYLLTAMRFYIRGLECADWNMLQIFRVAHLWLENASHQEMNSLLDENLFRIPSYKFLPLLPQLTPHMSHVEDNFSRKVNMLVEQCAVEHPHHTLQHVLGLANAHKDKEICGMDLQSLTQEPRVLGAKQMVQRLNKNKQVGLLVQQMNSVSLALISLAYYKADNKKSVQIPRTEPITRLKNLDSVLVPTLNIPIKPNGHYNVVTGIAGYENSFSLVGGVTAPKKIVCLGTDGVKRPQLVKGRDDLRQDAVMQQVFTMMNTFLDRNKETLRRKLLMRTYKVVPLSQRSGVIEWCENTEVLAFYLIGSDHKSGAHKRYYPNDLTGLTCRNMMKKVASQSNERKLEVYKQICKSLHPVLHKFFLENFPAPGIWFERRLAYIHSVATSSMIGYILGLGDRHVNNILLDKNTAEVIHIDFGIAFEMGRILPTPETVPFRLTRDIVDGMGVSGVEGVFRRCCEKTMSVLRQNQEIILTILEVLLYDPLYAWTITPKKAYNMQCHSGSLRDEPENEEEPSGDVNKMAERALLRLQQKLHGTEDGMTSSIEGQVNQLLQQAQDQANLSRLFDGWQPYL